MAVRPLADSPRAPATSPPHGPVNGPESSSGGGPGAGGAPVLGRLVERRAAWRPFVAIGSVCVVAGGVVAAVTGPTGFERGSWTAAFLVLVGGVAQIVLGGGQAWLAAGDPAPGRVRAEVVVWNGGVAVTVIGTLASVPVLTTLAGLALAAGLVAFIATTRAGSSPWRGALRAYRGVAAALAVSIPIGLVLAWVRRG